MWSVIRSVWMILNFHVTRWSSTFVWSVFRPWKHKNTSHWWKSLPIIWSIWKKNVTFCSIAKPNPNFHYLWKKSKINWMLTKAVYCPSVGVLRLIFIDNQSINRSFDQFNWLFFLVWNRIHTAESTTIYLKVPTVHPEPGQVDDLDVPILSISPTTCKSNNLDLTTQKVKEILAQQNISHTHF